jgi:hypothetical protein
MNRESHLTKARLRLTYLLLSSLALISVISIAQVEAQESDASR